MSNKINKLVNIYKEKGINSFIKKTGGYLHREIKKVVPSIEVALSDDSIIVSYCDSIENKRNFGDALNPLLVNELSGKKVYSYSNIRNLKNKPIYSVIGSVLNNKDIKDLEVWGSGFISKEGQFKIHPKKIHAVRGPLTRELILKQGIDCPEVYGDPALLMPMIYKSNKTKKFKTGIIAHYIDKNNKYINLFKNKHKDDVLIIDIEDNIFNVVDNVNKCEFIASSSLHGLIISDAYGIPSLWIKLSDKLYGGDFKFIDYMMSVDKKQLNPFIINNEFQMQGLTSRLSNNEIKFDADKLLESCPFYYAK